MGQSAENMEYFLVLAGFRNAERAAMVLEGFNQGDVASYSIEETELDDAPWFRVLYGPFERALGSVKAEFNSQGVTDAWWIRRELEEAPMIAADIEVISVIPVAFSMASCPGRLRPTP